MTAADFRAILPLAIAGYVPCLLLAVSAWTRRRGVIVIEILSLAGLAAAFLSVFAAAGEAPRDVTPLFRIDAFSLFWMGLLFASGFAALLLSRDYLRARSARPDRFYLLTLFSVAGMAAAAASRHFIGFFLGLETLTISLYGLIGFTREDRASLEAAMKYLVLAATSSAFLLFGIALLYASLGSMDFLVLSESLAELGEPPATVLFGLALVLVGFGFKLALVPFHLWSPDVYQGAPPPAAILIATGSKGAVFALLFRLVGSLDLARAPALSTLLTALALLTMFGGNLLALLQTNVRRILAGSSIAHMGYLLIPLLAGGAAGVSSFGFYLAAYFATMIAAFGVISVLSARGGELQEIEDFRGLARERPFPAIVFALAMISLVGIPLTAGFVAKFYIFGAGLGADLWGLVIAAIASSAISAFYYLRVIAALFSPSPAGVHESSAEHGVAREGRGEAAPGGAAVTLAAGPLESPAPRRVYGRAGIAGTATLVALALVLFFFGVYPSPLVRLAQFAAGLNPWYP